MLMGFCVLSTQISAGALPEEALLLDYLHHSTAAGHARLALSQHTLHALCALAERSAAAFAVSGLPDLALQSLCLTEAWTAADVDGKISLSHRQLPHLRQRSDAKIRVSLISLM